MKQIKNIVSLLFSAIFVLSCSQQKARRPISESSGTFMRESAERNKKLIACDISLPFSKFYQLQKRLKVFYLVTILTGN